MAALIPLYRHPTMTVLVDDDRSSLAILQHQLEQTFARVGFSRARAALDWIRASFTTMRMDSPLALRYSEEADDLVRPGSDMELDSIFRYVSDPQRFAVPTVVVIDYLMPDMDGVEFCKSVADLPLKKIMFTSVGHDRVAINAFNQGLIQRFIHKREPEALDLLEEGIEALQSDYFLRQSWSQVGTMEDPRYSFLSDEGVDALVRDLCDRYGFVEHYLLSSPAGFIFFTEDGHGTRLVLMTRDGLQDQAAAMLRMGADEDAVDDVQACRVVPFFHTPYGLWSDQLPGAAADYCKAAQVCSGQQDYYWALFELPAHYQKGHAYPHAQFLREHAASLP